MESLPVPSVQAMVAATGGAHVPPRYLRPEVAADAAASDGEAEIPIIDFERLLLHPEPEEEEACRGESARLHAACQEWGFFQLINHGVPDDVIEGMKANIGAFFGLPAETKQQFAQERGQLEGYGQLFVVSEDQKLDWADILYLNTQPPEHRSMRFWPDKPDTLRSTLEAYSAAVKTVAGRLLAIMSNNLGLPPEVIASKCAGGGIQSVRMNYYPPCAEADKVVGFSPHSDADLLTLVLQVNQVQGLQVKRQDGSWVPVRPLKGAFVVNVGDILQVLHCILHSDQEEPMYKTVDHQSFMSLFFSAKLEGKSFLQRMKLDLDTAS
ncbi:S-norcoclaurine synthase 1-like [Panicum miliaceum]|uniref:S-norcoclaurine synthase 1-like n=1 Tax=Panicum miliaceum TaxID=4540 RepID=A0A3L6TL56_PANMI|nr:S-norcoclaurine synthase 1-like [Panicum miliaceum]